VVSPFPIGASTDYELIVNGDAQVTGTMWAGNFSSLILAAPTIKFDNAMPYTPGGDMTFSGGNVNFNGGGLVGDVITVDNVPGGAYGIHIMSQAGTGGLKVTGAPGSLIGVDVDPYATGIRVDATNTGIQIMNAPTSILADGIIDSRGTIENNATNVVIVNDGLSQTGGGQVTLSGNVDALAGLDVTGASTFAGTMTQTGGGAVNLSGTVAGAAAVTRSVTARMQRS
jgi:hypothetical protein